MLKKTTIIVTLLILTIVTISGCTESENTTNVSNYTKTPQHNDTSIKNDSKEKAASHVLLEKNNVKMANGKIYVDNEVVGTYTNVNEPPTESADVEKRLWNNKRVEIIDYSGSESDPLTYYTEYNGEWIKMRIYTDLSKTPLELTDDIYNAMG